MGKIPTKAKKTKVSKRFLLYLVFEHEERYWLKKRTEKEIWANMYDFYLVEMENLEYEEKVQEYIEKLKAEVEEINLYPVVNHILTHQKQQIIFVKVKYKSAPALTDGNWYSWDEIERLAKPKIIVDFMTNLKKA
jgi:A/G-specific adenine glycosylase